MELDEPLSLLAEGRGALLLVRDAEPLELRGASYEVEARGLGLAEGREVGALTEGRDGEALEREGEGEALGREGEALGREGEALGRDAPELGDELGRDMPPPLEAGRPPPWPGRCANPSGARARRPARASARQVNRWRRRMGDPTVAAEVGTRNDWTVPVHCKSNAALLAPLS